MIRTLVQLALAITALVPTALPQAAPAAAPAPAGSKEIKEFHLYAVDGDLEMADGNSIYVMGFSTWNDAFQAAPQPFTKEIHSKLSERLTVPGPELRVKVGDKVRVVLHNAGLCCAKAESHLQRTTHTIHFHGLDLLAQVDGVPDLPVKPVEEGKEFAYEFIPDYEGTYLYHCHVDSATHILMGMYGTVIVEGPEPKTIYGHKFDREYTLFFSEMDSKHNQAMRTKGSYNMLDWKSDYFLLNGRIYVSNLKNPLSTVNDPKSRLVCKVGETVLLRVVAIGNNHTFALHPHAYHMTVVGTDGRKHPAPYEKDTLPIVSGERYDVLVKIGPKHLGLCTSCNIGPGVSIVHDHNMRGMTSDGKYPQGPLTIFEVKE